FNGAGTVSVAAGAFTDTAGNPNAAAALAPPITIDVVPPPPPSVPDLLSEDDKGTSSTDNRTSVRNPRFTGTAAPFSTVTLLLSPGNTIEIGRGVADAAGLWTIPTVLGDGTYAIVAKAIDDAGNESTASAALTPIVIAGSTPAAPTLQLNAASDSAKKGDGITNLALPSFSGTAAAGLKVNVFRVLLGSDVSPTPLGTATVTATKGSASGTWTLTTPAKQAFPSNKWRVIAQTENEFGAKSAEVAITLTVDTVAPAAPAGVDLASESDTGTANDDNYTSDTTPTITGTAEDGSTVTVLANATVLGTAIAVDGVWSVTPTVALKAGTYAITAKATDAAGNVGPASAKTGPGSLSIVIDTTVTTPSTPDLISLDDKGASSTDNKTNVTTPTFTGTAEPFATVTLLADTKAVGTGSADAKGAWSIKLGTALADGTYSMTAKSVDKAGNASPASKALTPVVISTSAPATPSVSLSASTDTGVKGDNATNSLTPAFNGDAPAGAKVNLYRVTTTGSAAPEFLGTASVGAAKTGTTVGAWSFATPTKQPFTEAAWRVIAKTLDVFGNESAGTEAALTISRTVPTVAQWVQESKQSVTVTFSRPTTGLKAASLRYVGTLGTAVVDLPITDSKVIAELGTAPVTAVSPDADGYASTWRITFNKGVATGKSFTLRLRAAGAGIADRFANALKADSQATIAG
ncbi:MAG: Ig-like domain-containing protein, partial [Planctomycetia bacterium]